MRPERSRCIRMALAEGLRELKHVACRFRARCGASTPWRPRDLRQVACKRGDTATYAVGATHCHAVAASTRDTLWLRAAIKTSCQCLEVLLRPSFRRMSR
jgi:hypothetical protein